MLPTTIFRFQLVLLVSLLSSEIRCAEDWPQFGGPNRDFRNSNAQSVNSKGANSSVPTPWSIELVDGDAAPILVQGNLFVASVAFSDEGYETLQIQCLNAFTGTPVWDQTLVERSYVSQSINDFYPVRPMASHVAAKGLVISVSFGGCVACLDALDGTIRWQFDLVRDFSATPLQFGWSSSPWSDGHNVVVACGCAEAMLLALDLDSGKATWKAGKGEAAYGSLSETKIDDGSSTLCYVGRDEMIGVKSTDGEVLWRYPLPKPGLTNAVTPIAFGQSKWLVAGQGFEACRLLDVQRESGTSQDRFAVGCDNGSVFVWTDSVVGSPIPFASSSNPMGGAIQTMEFSEDGSSLLVAGKGGIVLFDSATGQAIHSAGQSRAVLSRAVQLGHAVTVFKGWQHARGGNDQ